MKKQFNINIPETYPINVDLLKNIINDNKEILLNFHPPYIIRSSSPLEGFNGEKVELSGIYKSLICYDGNIIKSIKDLIEYNNSEHIIYVHKKYNYKMHPYIPVLIQPLIIGEISGIINFEKNILYVEYVNGFNFGITGGIEKNIEYIEYDLLKNKLIKGKENYLNIILKSIYNIQIYYKYFNIEFSIKDNIFFLLQFKDTSKIFNKKNIIYIYSELYTLMEKLGYKYNEYSIEENDVFMFFNYLGIEQNKNEDIEHIRIYIDKIKFDYFDVKKGENNDIRYVSPKDKNLLLLIKDFYEKLGLTILLVNYNSSNFSKRTLNFNYNFEFKLNFILDFECSSGFVGSKSDKFFFINRLSSSNFIEISKAYVFKLNNLKNILINFKLNNFTKLYLKSKILDCKSKIIYLKENKEYFLKKDIGKKICKGNYIGFNRGIIGGKIITNILDSTIKDKKQRIFYYCNDFEPSLIFYLDFIDLIIISRPYKGSHGVAIAREFNKDILYDVRNDGNILIDGAFVKINLDTGIIYKD